MKTYYIIIVFILLLLFFIYCVLSFKYIPFNLVSLHSNWLNILDQIAANYTISLGVVTCIITTSSIDIKSAHPLS